MNTSGGGGDRIASYFDRTALSYDRSMERFERFVFGRSRQWIGEHARGNVLEVAVGTGLNIPYYQHASRFIGVDISTQMLKIAQARAAISYHYERQVFLAVGDAEALAFPREVFDCVVSCYSMCTFTDPGAVAAEAWRVLHPGGRLILVEHGPSTWGAIRVLQSVIEPLSVRLQGDHLTRDPTPYIEAAGFQVEQAYRDRVGLVYRIIASKSGAR
jgi:ubiquinone/menaquinone biosynthesis C-methylase UbiE